MIKMKKFKIPIYAFDFINGLLRINGDIALSKKTTANDVKNRIINTFLINPRTPEPGIFIFDINGWVDEHVVEMISLKETFSKIDYVTIYYFENNSFGNGISESSLVKKIQKQCGNPGKIKGLSEIVFQFPWGRIIVHHDIKVSSSCIILQYKKNTPRINSSCREKMILQNH